MFKAGFHTVREVAQRVVHKMQNGPNYIEQSWLVSISSIFLIMEMHPHL